MEALRGKLAQALSAQFDNEAEAAAARLKDGVLPYTRFVRAELDRVEKARRVLAGLRQRVSALKARAQAA
jgi:hypothetical protein